MKTVIAIALLVALSSAARADDLDDLASTCEQHRANPHPGVATGYDSPWGQICERTVAEWQSRKKQRQELDEKTNPELRDAADKARKLGIIK